MISISPRGLRLASGLLLAIGAAGFAATGHAHAEGADVPAVTRFYWHVELQSISIGGVSPDLASAVSLAGLGLVLTDEDKDYIATSLTGQALAFGVSMTGDAPAAVAVVAAPAVTTRDSAE